MIPLSFPISGLLFLLLLSVPMVSNSREFSMNYMLTEKLKQEKLNQKNLKLNMNDRD